MHSNSYIEMYGGGTTGSTAGFDGLVQMGGRHYFAGLGMFTSRMGNDPYAPKLGIVATPQVKEALPSSYEPWEEGECVPTCYDWNCLTHPRCPGDQFANCWYGGDPTSEDEFSCLVPLIARNCDSCEGIVCPGDLKDCTSRSDAEAQYPGFAVDCDLAPDFQVYDPSDLEKFADYVEYIENIRTRMTSHIDSIDCIEDPLLKRCVMGSLSDPAFAPPIYLNCPQFCARKPGSGATHYGCTSCVPPGICICVSNINQDAQKYHMTVNDFLDSVILHELIHWCMNCRFKRTSPGAGMVAYTCQFECYAASYYWQEVAGQAGDYGSMAAGHGWPADWLEGANCAVCPPTRYPPDP